uniref:Uncharacterized protein n=1 Tax=Anopheles albimanus TaxID=7167 RepID=A0A182FXM0_ANOAL
LEQSAGSGTSTGVSGLILLGQAAASQSTVSATAQAPNTRSNNRPSAHSRNEPIPWKHSV